MARQVYNNFFIGDEIEISATTMNAGCVFLAEDTRSFWGVDENLLVFEIGTSSGTTSTVDDYVTGSTFNTSTGDLTLDRLSGGTVVTNLDDRYSLTGHTHDLSDSIGVAELKPELKASTDLVGLDVDWDDGIQYSYTMSAATELTFSNILEGKTIMLVIDGDYTLTLPTGVNTVDLINFDGTKTNYIQIYCVDDSTPLFISGLKNY